MQKYKLKRKYQVKFNQFLVVIALIIIITVLIELTPFSFNQSSDSINGTQLVYAENKEDRDVVEFNSTIVKSTQIAADPFSKDHFIYVEDIPMPKEHQEYLYNRSLALDLDYKMLLAVIATESTFNPNAIGATNDFGYFQINKINHTQLADVLNTENQPLDPFINITWGTYMLADLFNYWSEKGLVGTELNHHVWSSYNKGILGFKKYGFAENYISKIETNMREIENILDKTIRAI